MISYPTADQIFRNNVSLAKLTMTPLSLGGFSLQFIEDGLPHSPTVEETAAMELLWSPSLGNFSHEFMHWLYERNEDPRFEPLRHKADAVMEEQAMWMDILCGPDCD